MAKKTAGGTPAEARGKIAALLDRIAAIGRREAARRRKAPDATIEELTEIGAEAGRIAAACRPLLSGEQQARLDDTRGRVNDGFALILRNLKGRAS